jgi:hypothetical protein
MAYARWALDSGVYVYMDIDYGLTCYTGNPIRRYSTRVYSEMITYLSTLTCRVPQFCFDELRHEMVVNGDKI